MAGNGLPECDAVAPLGPAESCLVRKWTPEAICQTTVMMELLHEYRDAIWWFAVLSLVVFAGSLIAVPWIVVHMPADYFISSHRPKSRFTTIHPIVGWAARILKNLVGIALIFAGLAMLVLPGQGLMTLAIGILLMDFPGKHRVERRIVSAGPVLKSLNWLRLRANVAPLRFESGTGNDPASQD